MNQLTSLIRRKTQRISFRMLHLFSLCTGFPELRFYCPACENNVPFWACFDRNIGHGFNKTEPDKRLCPLCRSFERTRQFALYLEQELILEIKPRMLHFAPERSLVPRLRAELGDRYVTTDLFMKSVDRKEDITKLSFENDAFDFIYCSNVLEHIENDTAALSELYRVLAPNGVAIIQVPIRGKITYEDASITDPFERYKHFGQADHVRYYGEDIENRMRAAGFEVEPFYMLDVLKLPENDINRMNISRRELIHRCVKL